MTVTAVNLCSQAFLLIGASTIQTFTENSREAEVAANLYETIRDFELASYQWNFATTTKELGKLNVTLDFKKWDNAFQIPVDCLRAISCTDDQDCPIFSEVAEDRVYSDEDRVFLRYIRQVSEKDFPVYFQENLIHKLAWRFAEPITANGALGETCKEAYGIANKKSRYIDAQANIMPALIDSGQSQILRVRF